MFKKAILISLISAFILPLTIEASYFTILLKNGNNIDVSSYLDSDSKIKFGYYGYIHVERLYDMFFKNHPNIELIRKLTSSFLLVKRCFS